MNPQVNAIANRLSLRTPQRSALEILDRVCEIVSPGKDTDRDQALEIIKSEFRTVTDFEREFPSLCFALATGVGKTRLMGAFIAYLHRVEEIQHFFVLAPNLTIYNKLITDFTPNTPKYVFQGISEFAMTQPEIITGDNYESGIGIRKGKLFADDEVHINIFNVSKINSEVRGDRAPRIKRLSEYVGESYFDYLSKLDDLVLLMDESHRYRASAGVRAINELKPILGLELTATPQVEKGTKAEPFKNVIYSYPLSAALKDGFVKEPAVATRENFNAKNYTEESLERLKLEDGVRVHEETKAQLELYSRENDRPRVKPFMLVVAKDTNHADEIIKIIEGDEFFGGQYKGRVITVHSKLKGDEADETVQQLLTVENPDNPTEIVVHVNMLKEGWDVTNLYTIVPLRTANSKTLVEQSIGRGLRLPYGKRVGVPAVDRLTIVSHDRFQEIIDEANKPESIIRTGVIIGRDIPDKKSAVVEVKPKLNASLDEPTTTGEPTIPGTTVQKPLFDTPEERQAARVTLKVIREFEELRRSSDLKKPETQAKIVARVRETIKPRQTMLPGVVEEVDVERVVKETTDRFVEMTIDIPRIVVVPTGEVTAGYREFDLDVAAIRYQPVAYDILIQHLHDHERHMLRTVESGPIEERLENHLISGLIDFDDVSYDDHAETLYKLAGQCVAHLRSYLKDESEVENVLVAHRKDLVRNIHAQMQEHYEETATRYEAKVSKGFTTLRSEHCIVPTGEKVRPFRQPVDEKQLIRGMLFGGFAKNAREAEKFQSDSERRLAVVLENDEKVLKWLRPVKGDFQIRYNRNDDEYIPDFVAETATGRFILEPKAASDMKDDEVIAKANAAAEWCRHATDHADKPWSYVLIPHDAIDESKSLAGLAAAYTYRSD